MKVDPIMVAREDERAAKHLERMIREFTGENPTGLTLLALGNAMVLTGMIPLAMGAAVQGVPLQGAREVLSGLFAEMSVVFEREYPNAKTYLAQRKEES